jgi:hypothetical protein
MTGKRYYLTTLGAWQRHIHRYANSHFVVLAQAQPAATENASRADSDAPSIVPALTPQQKTCVNQTAPDDNLVTARQVVVPTPEIPAVGCGEGNCLSSRASATRDVLAASPDATLILVLVEGDEGAHLALDDDPAFEALPHPLAQKRISDAMPHSLPTALHLALRRSTPPKPSPASTPSSATASSDWHG